MDNLRITFNFTSPVIMTKPLHFDAVLSYAMFQHTDDLDVAHNQLPLKKSKGIYHASALRLQHPIRQVECDFNGGVRQGDQDVSLFKPTSKRGNKYGYIDTVRGDHKSFMNTYTGYESAHHKGYFYVCGDKDEIKRLLDAYVFALGKKGHSGSYGSFDSYSIEEVDQDYSLRHPKMGVMRALPISEFSEFSTDECCTEYSGFYPPYYQTGAQMCLMPLSIVDNSKIDVVVDDFF